MLPTRFLLCLSGIVVFASSSPAQYGHTLIVETGVPYAGVGTFTSFFPVLPSLTSTPSPGGTLLAFGGNLTTGDLGIFTATGPGSVTAFATTQTPVPGGTGLFTGFYGAPVSVSGNSVVFAGHGNPGPTNAGIYSNMTGSLQPVINNSTPYPGGGLFTNFSSPAISGTTVIFSGTRGSGPPIGVFTRDGSGGLVTVADRTTVVPGTSSTFIDFTDGPAFSQTPFLPNISGANYVLGGNGGNRMGLFTNIGGSLTAVATTVTSVPGTNGTFIAFGLRPIIEGNTITFYGQGFNQVSYSGGVYSWRNGTLSVVADTTTIAPGGNEPFGYIDSRVAASQGKVAFLGSTSSDHAIYTDLTGQLSRIVGINDMIDGKTVVDVQIGEFAFNGDRISAWVMFSDNSEGIYTFTPAPEPGSVLLVAVFATAAGSVAMRYRRRLRM
jgi:hypothetical protein